MPSGERRTECMVFNLRGELETLDNNKLKEMTSSISAHRLPDQLRETSPGEQKHRQTVWNRKSYKQIKIPVSVENWMKGTPRSFRAFRCCCIGKKLDSKSGNRGEKTPDVDVLINSLKRDTQLSRDVPLHQNFGTQQEMEKADQKIVWSARHSIRAKE